MKRTETWNGSVEPSEIMRDMNNNIVRTTWIIAVSEDGASIWSSIGDRSIMIVDVGDIARLYESDIADPTTKHY